MFQEPKENGPLFVEMHFYMRNAKQEDIEKFKKDQKLKALGMPEYIGQGSHEIQKIKHRFIVLPRFGRDIYKFLEDHNNKFPLHTVYRLGWQILHVLQYIHSRTYVHCDIKAANIMLGFGKGGEEQVYLLDFGLACHYNTKDFKPDPKKMHNGTIEYTSRDAHHGVPTMRGDIEILAYNLIDWAGGKLPWVTKNLLAKPVDVQKAKEEFMKSPEKSVKSCFESTPVHIIDIFKYLGSMNHDTVPDYTKLRGILEAGVKEQGQKNSGALEFSGAKNKAPAVKVPRGRSTLQKASAVDDTQPGPSKAATKRVRVTKQTLEEISDSDDEIIPTRKASPKKKPQQPKEDNIPKIRVNPRNQERKRIVHDSDDGDDSEDEIQPKKKSPQKPARAVKSPAKASRESPPSKKPKGADDKETEADDNKTITLKSKGKSSKGKKVIHLNFNLDVSLNSDVVVVVNRKNKKKKENDMNADDAPKPDENSPMQTNRAGVYKGKFAKTQ